MSNFTKGKENGKQNINKQLNNLYLVNIDSYNIFYGLKTIRAFEVQTPDLLHTSQVRYPLHHATPQRSWNWKAHGIDLYTFRK